MANWDDAQTTFLQAAAKVYAALKIAHPSGNYGSGIWVSLSIDGSNYPCRCDCTGVIQCIIRVMGYDPNWHTSSVPGHRGDGWYLTDASGPFVKDSSGNISPDWEVLAFNASDARPGDIRAASSHSHCDIFVGYKNGHAYGLNAGSGPNTGGQAIPISSNAGTSFLQTNNPEDLVATWTIQDNEAAKVLRFVRNAGVGGGGGVFYSNGSQSLRNLDVELRFIEKVQFKYLLRNQIDEFIQKVPGYYKYIDLYPSAGKIAYDLYSDSWVEFVPTYTVLYTNADSDAEWKQACEAGLIMMFTLDNSDPLLYGRTVLVKPDGSNDYEASKGYVPVLRVQFPVHFRCVLTDADTHSKDYGRSSAYLTNESSDDSNSKVTQCVKAMRNLAFLTDASDKSFDVEDDHGYLFLHDEDTFYEKNSYINWLQGLEE